MRPIRTIATVVVVGLTATACGTITGGSRQNINVTTTYYGQPVGPIKCSVRPEANEHGWTADWKSYMTAPGSIEVEVAPAKLIIRCEDENYPTGELTVEASMSAETWGSTILFPIAGQLIDMASGAAWDYPSNVTVRMGETSTIEGGRMFGSDS